MKVKICGMRKAQNVGDVAGFRPDYLGFIFYKKSPRMVDTANLHNTLSVVPESTSKVAVFVNESVTRILELCEEFGFTHVQLHGDESPEECQSIRESGRKVIKAFPVADRIQLESLKAYEHAVDFFLFDTKTSKYGGSGKQFDRTLLAEYPLKTPYFLSGGIGESDIEEILESDLPNCFGVDANSRLETKPGFKDTEATKRLITKIRNR